MVNVQKVAGVEEGAFRTSGMSFISCSGLASLNKECFALKDPINNIPIKNIGIKSDRAIGMQRTHRLTPTMAGKTKCLLK
jgi:hypothetical protein